jgi:toxin FitB
MLLDSNILIYAALPQHSVLRRLIEQHSPAVSVISRIEVLGYHRLQAAERQLLEQLFDLTEILPLSDSVVQRAIELRQQRKMTLGDSIVAATALIQQRVLVTRNTDDFAWIPGLQILNPLNLG